MARCAWTSISGLFTPSAVHSWEPVVVAIGTAATPARAMSRTGMPNVRRHERRTAITTAPSAASGSSTTTACTTSGCSGIPSMVHMPCSTSDRDIRFIRAGHRVAL